MIITFGKHKGSSVQDTPTDYLQWGASNLDSPKWKKAFRNELDRRDAETQDLLKNNPDELLKKLAAEELRDIRAAITESGCEHEYHTFDEESEAEERAKEKLKSLQTDAAVKNLRKEFSTKLPDVNEKVLNKILSIHWNHGLERSQFSSQEKYQLACDYVARLEALY